jgi:hypothetical protein
LEIRVKLFILKARRSEVNNLIINKCKH